jgi:3-hydroxyisobutyrate dehydrogenase-like beta-hydroxyacid dehydrogenase
MAANLLEAGFAVTGFDLRDEALERFAAAGGTPAGSVEAVLDAQSTVAFCLAGHPMEELCERVVLGRVRRGQIIVDHATMPAPSTRELHRRFAAQGARYCDATISGGAGGAAAGALKVFFGGARSDFDALQPYFRAVADPETIFYAGEGGMGQVMKAVQNMSSWYLDAIRMEIIAFGLHSGLSWDQIRQAVNEHRSPGPFSATIRRVQGDDPAFKTAVNAEFDYFLEETKANGFPMPAMRGLMEYLHQQERDTIDFVNRPGHNIWKRFMTDGENQAGVPRE